jgi:NAD(P)-dependent dehydrogenase (short-subunit alcohol dehydrogenase family)
MTVSTRITTPFGAESTAAEVVDGIDLTGRRAIVTGGASGIGVETARALAGAGAEVTLAVRNVEAGERTAADIAETTGNKQLLVARLDLADQASVAAFAAQWDGPLHILVNNAGIMACPPRRTTEGWELQFATNHLGHFALTGLLLGRLLSAPAPRVVTVSSTLHRRGKMNFDDLQGERNYSPWGAYGQSKLANLMFCFELQRRATEAGTALLSMAAHPGYAATNLQFAATDRFYEKAFGWIGNRLLAQSADMGALPTLYAATVADLPGGTYVGPGGRSEQRGYPKVVTAAGKAYDEAAWRRLWEVSEELTGVHYDFAAAGATA